MYLKMIYTKFEEPRRTETQYEVNLCVSEWKAGQFLQYICWN